MNRKDGGTGEEMEMGGCNNRVGFASETFIIVSLYLYTRKVAGESV